jgi:hypothetical protein
MGDVDDRVRDLHDQRDFLLRDLEDISRGARFFRNDDDITDRMRARSIRMLLQIDAALAAYEKQLKSG